MFDDPWQMPGLIFTRRLYVVPLNAAFLAASLDGDRDTAEKILGATIPEEWFDEPARIGRRLEQMQADPGLEVWLSRAIVWREKPPISGNPPFLDTPAPEDRLVMVGQIGFHSWPDPPYLADIAPGGVEIGYVVFSPYRRRGFAREACEALIEWAFLMEEINRFVLSISPANIASTRLALSMGFKVVGSQIDEEDGAEDIFVLDRTPRHLLPQPPATMIE
ncbi:MAG: GNAT family N-acetyltransferase [Candidatus Promineofilum sp.]|uniref:GNAT family N-acetyltransferase n=1 Tax=Promineifilum sp. TaxID=2664178 RepID=UPI002411E515|nr:GNAT family N-acetyltransferase [Promineifilum sp.]MCO5180149.1 GNAT family N-acetyltransferase [Promineifilum sp.]